MRVAILFRVLHFQAIRLGKRRVLFEKLMFHFTRGFFYSLSLFASFACMHVHIFFFSFWKMNNVLANEINYTFYFSRWDISYLKSLSVSLMRVGARTHLHTLYLSNWKHIFHLFCVLFFILSAHFQLSRSFQIRCNQFHWKIYIRTIHSYL